MKRIITLICSIALCSISASAQTGNIGIGTRNPTSKLHVTGSVALGYRIVTASSTLDGNDYAVEFNGTSAVTLTLPDATASAGRIYNIKNSSTTSPTPIVTLSGQSGQTIDGKSTWVLDTKNEIVNLISNGSNWNVNIQQTPTVVTDSTGGSWIQGGNTDPGSAVRKFGTITNNDIPVITNNTECMRITKTGKVGIGTQTPSSKLEIASGTSNTSGLKFTNLNNSSPSTSSTALLGVDASGNVVVSGVASTGPTGPTGSAGTNGTNGLNGAAGATGPTGAVGANGSNGAAGATGPTGVAGTNGSNGAAGATGPTGAAGANGAPGPTGAAGTNGSNGAAGANGATGPTGAAGTNGTNGSNGAAGATGPTGAAGATGSTGATGFLTAGSAAGNTPYWNGSAWVVNSSNIYNNGGNIGIGTNSPSSLIDVENGVTTNNTVVNAAGSINDFLQYNVQNTSTGTHAQSGYSATADNGTSTTGFAWMGINNSTFNYPTAYNLGGANDVSYMTSGQDMYIANANNSKSIIFSMGTATTPFFAERMRITNSGNVGIGTSTPSNALSVVSASNPLYLGGLQNGASSDSVLTILNGVVRKGALSSGSGWALGGNSVGSMQKLGTTSNYSLPIITNNTERMRIDSLGNIGMGTTSPQAKLDVEFGTTTNNTVINAAGSINDFLQFNVQNTSTGTHAQSGYSATADNGTNTTGFAWMGINNSTFSYPTAYNIGGANDVSYVASGQDMYIANANNSKSIIFSTGISASPYFAEKMRITNSGNVGIGTSSPAAALDVSGTYKLGTAGTVLTNMIKTNVTITDATTFDHSTTRIETVTVTGANLNANVIVNPRTALPYLLGINWVRVSAANTVVICFNNPEDNDRALGTVTFDITVIQ